MSPKSKRAKYFSLYILIPLIVIAGCKDERSHVFAHISLDKSESSYDSVADSTTRTQIRVEIDDTGSFWMAIIDSVSRKGASLSSVPMVSMDTVVEVNAGVYGAFSINATSCDEGSFVVSYYDSAKQYLKYFSLSAQTEGAIRARIQYLAQDAPRTGLIYQSAGNSLIPSSTPGCDTAAGFGDCIKLKTDSCMTDDTRIYSAVGYPPGRSEAPSLRSSERVDHKPTRR